MSERLLAMGVDGAPGGWVAAVCWGEAVDVPPAQRRTEPVFFTTIEKLANWRTQQAGGTEAPVAVDIPIGLPEVVRYRACDEEARRRLPAGRKGSVFHPPGRYLLERATAPVGGKPPSAKAVFARVQELVAEQQERLDGAAAATGEKSEKLRSLGQQGSAIVLKVAEVDAFLRQPPLGPEEADRQRWLFEVHPEMGFRTMNGGNVPPAKLSAHGQLDRLEFLRREFPDADERIRAWPDGARYSLLDVCDAYAACWTAVRWANTGSGAVHLRAEVDPPLEVLGEDAPGKSPREKATDLMMRMVV